MRRGPGEFHSFPESVKAFEGAGTVRTITGGDGVARQMLEIPGSYATPGNVLNGGGVWRDGVFQFIKEADGTINHRLFVPGP
jgi:filamentous hemagglutinin